MEFEVGKLTLNQFNPKEREREALLSFRLFPRLFYVLFYFPWPIFQIFARKSMPSTEKGQMTIESWLE